MRAHVVLAEDLIRDVDAVVGKGKRSRFIEEAVREKLRQEKLLSALAETAGILSADDYPEWETPEKVASWVRELRQQRDRRLERRDGG